MKAEPNQREGESNIESKAERKLTRCEPQNAAIRTQMNTNKENRTQPEFEQGTGGRIRLQLNKIDPEFCKIKPKA